MATILYFLAGAKDVNVATFNCNSLRCNIDTIRDLLSQNDILFLQETMLNEHLFDIYEGLSPDFDFSAIPSIESNQGGRPKAGLAILWRKDLNVTTDIHSENIISALLKFRDQSVLIVNVYLPCDYGNEDALISYKDNLAILKDVVDNSITDNVILAGDFNCDLNKGRFFNYFLDFVNEINFDIKDLNLPNDSFTYISSGHSSTSWLDHVVAPKHQGLLSNIEILYESSFYDHIPIQFSINISSNVINDRISSFNIKEFVRWDKFNDADKLNYANNVNDKVIDYFCDAFLCNNYQCNNENHRSQLICAYNFIVNEFKNASAEFTIQNKERKYKPIPGWNDDVKQLHHIARFYFMQWKDQGRLRIGHLYERMKSSRSEFKKALRICRNNEDYIKKQKLCASFQSKDKTQFWKDVKHLKPHNTGVSLRIDSYDNPLDIANHFSNKFQLILDDPRSQVKPSNFENKLNFLNANYVKILPNKVIEAVSKLNSCIGWNNIHFNHIKVSPYSVVIFFSRLF